MPNHFIISAHPNPKSFIGAWASASARAAAELGAVAVSDLYAMQFDPVERASNPLETQYRASAGSAWADDVALEIDKIRAADVIVFHFPIWWFGAPAILKGWLDRCLVHGGLHDVDHRFDRGFCRGKTALFCVSTGATEVEVGPAGKEGRLDLLLWPLAYTLRYCGFEIADPVAVHGVHGYWEGAQKAALEARLTRVLDGQPAVIRTLAARRRWRFNADTDFDTAGQLHPDAERIWPFTA